MAGAMRNCCCFVYTTLTCTSLQCRFIRSQISSMHVFLTCNLPPALLAEWPGPFTCYCGNTGVERIPNSESTQKIDPGEENSSFQSRVRRSTTEPLPFSSHLRSPTPSPPILAYLSCLLLIFKTFFNSIFMRHSTRQIRSLNVSGCASFQRPITIKEIPSVSNFRQIIIIHPNK